MVASTVGSATITGWKRRSSAGSFSMYLRYSSSVVAPTQRNSPRASCGFMMFAASRRAFRRARADERVQFVNEQNDFAFAGDDLLEKRLEPVFKFAAIFRAGDHRAQIHRDELLVLERFRHVAADDAPGQALGDGRLAHAGFADEHGIIFRAAREHLHHAADFLVAADDRINLALLRERGEVATVFFQRLEFRLGILVGDALIAAQFGEGFQDGIALQAVLW